MKEPSKEMRIQMIGARLEFPDVQWKYSTADDVPIAVITPQGHRLWRNYNKDVKDCLCVLPELATRLNANNFSILMLGLDNALTAKDESKVIRLITGAMLECDS